MIYQGLYNILNGYLGEINLLYDNLQQYVKKEFKGIINNQVDPTKHDQIIDYIKPKIEALLSELEFTDNEINQEIRNSFIKPCTNEQYLTKSDDISDIFRDISDLLSEFILQRILKYLINGNSSASIVALKSKGILPVELLMELTSLKNLIDKSSKKKNLIKYLDIQKKIIEKFLNNREEIEAIQDYEDPADKLQLFYMVHRIIQFFDLHNQYDLTKIQEYIKNYCEEWLYTVPLVSQKNPDLYFCGIYLARQLEVELSEDDEDLIKYFLINVYDEIIDEFEAPLIEATSQVYYFLKSSDLAGLELSSLQIKELLKGDSNYFSRTQLKDMETSRLVIILKIYKMLSVNRLIEAEKRKNILDEIENRITAEGIKQFRDGFISAEATYYVIFCNYMRGTLKNLKELDFLPKIVSLIFRNLEILKISNETNYDLISEIFYACEALKLINCIENKYSVLHLVNNLFPVQVREKLFENTDIMNDISKYVKVKINKTTGEPVSI